MKNLQVHNAPNFVYLDNNTISDQFSSYFLGQELLLSYKSSTNLIFEQITPSQPTDMHVAIPV